MSDWRTREFPYVLLTEAAEAMGITTGRLRHSMVDGPDEGGALARRLGMFKFTGGRDWFIPRDRLLAELDRRHRHDWVECGPDYLPNSPYGHPEDFGRERCMACLCWREPPLSQGGNP